MSVVRLRPEHLADVAALEAAVFHAPWSAESLSILCGDGGFGFVAVEGGRVLAYGGMLTVLDEGQITNIATHPTARRRGLARAVLAAMVAEARARGVAQISLEVRESNEGALALYREFGFTLAGKRPRFYTHPTETALVMICDL